MGVERHGSVVLSRLLRRGGASDCTLPTLRRRPGRSRTRFRGATHPRARASAAGPTTVGAQVLGQRGARTAVPRLIGIVEEADDPYVVAEAIVALARIGDPAGLAVVDRISRQGSAVARAAARTALHERRPPPSGSPRPVEDGG